MYDTIALKEVRLLKGFYLDTQAEHTAKRTLIN